MKRVILLTLSLNLFSSIYGATVLEVYKKISKDLVIAPKCNQQVEEFLSNLTFGINSWAFRMLDAGSKIPSGILSLNFGELGNFQQCLDINENTKSGQISGKYCLGSVLPFVDRRVSRLLAQFNLTLPTITQTWALCIPDGCTAADANQIAKKFINLFTRNEAVSLKFSDLFCQTEKDTHRKLTPAAIGTITLLLMLTFAALFATFYDLYVGDSCPELIRVFSIHSNVKKIYRIIFCTKENINCLNGMRVLSSAWVVLDHQYLFMLFNAPVNMLSLVIQFNTFTSMFIVHGSFSMDTFFVIGGTTVAFSFLKAQYQERPHNVFYYVFQRYLRLVPSLIVIILIHNTLFHHMGNGPKWPIVEHVLQKRCMGYYGWMQFSFIQNYLHGVEHICLGHTWYLNVDMQLYLFVHLVLFFLWKYQKFVFKFMYVCMVLSLTSAFYVGWKYKLTAVGTNLYGNLTEFQHRYLYVTHIHAFSWILGFLLGHFLFQRQLNKTPLKLNKYFVIIAWFLSLVTLYTCLTIGFETLRGPEYNRWGNVLHVTFARPIWSMAIAWMILACASNHGGFINWILSHPLFRLMNMFSYGVYLLHASLMILVACNRKVPEYFSHFSVFFHFLVIMCISTGVSVLLVFLVDAPFAGIVALALGKKERKEKVK